MAPKKRKAADHCIRLPPRELSALGDPAARPVAPALLPFNEGPWTQPRPAPEVPTPSQAIVSTGASSSSSSHVVAGRSDTPVMQPYTRGDRELLMRLAEDAATRAECADEMQGLAYTNKAAEGRESRLKMWDEVAARAQLDPAVFNVKLVFTVMGLLRRAGYRSASQYLHVAKQRAIEAGSPPSPRTALACARADRASRRGRGPNKQAQPLPLHRFGELPATDAPWFTGGFANPQRALVSGCWRLHREL